MASSLTSASLRSGFLFLVFFALVILGVIYLLFFKQPSAIDSLNRQAFRLNFAAFKNGIQLANYKFIASQSEFNSDETLNRWIESDIGLDYNQAGFPIGTHIHNSIHQTPQTAEDCLNLWRFVLGPLQPAISIKASSETYWVEISNDNICVYRDSNIEELAILYHSKLGNVSLVDVN